MVDNPKSPELKKRMGRPKGALNKSTAFIKPIAQRYGPDCLQILINIAKNSQSQEANKIEACKLILAYGYGKPTESHEHSGPEGGPIPVNIEGVDQAIKELFGGVDKKS